MGKIINIPDAPKQLMKILLDAGYEAYVVGGCVRDFLLGRVPHDWDICTNALPAQMKECFADYHVIETGLQHGTLTVMVDHVGYEITTYRTDGEYTDHRHPDSVQFVGRLQEDLMRRDFTINAMAADISGKIRDFYDGQFDLEHKWIRCVGNPDKRFTEDPLRILRAMRFESKLGFTTEEKTEDSMRKHRYLLQHISAERINTELTGILMGDCYSTLACFPDVLSVCIPEIKQCIGFQQNNPHHNRNVWDHTLFAVSVAPKDIYTRLALLYHDIGKPLCYSEDSGVGHFYGHAAVSRDIAEKSLHNLRFDNQTIKLVTQLVEAHDRTIEPRKPVIRRCLNKMGIPHQKDQIVILLGDVGVNYFGDFRDQEAKVILQDSNRTYFCIHGNHERRPESLATYHSDVWHGGAVYIEDEYPNLIFAQDGEMFDLEGLQTLVLGGAYSVDKWYRLQSGYHWFEDEQIPEQRRKSILKKVKHLSKVDLVLSHTCPYRWQPFDLFLSGIDQNSVDNSTEYWLAEVERNLDYRYWLFGHFHDDRLINDKSQMLFKNVIDLEFLKE